MSTTKETIEFILQKLGNDERFHAKAMFGEYALYANDTVVGLICNDQLYVKILPASSKLEDQCEKDAPYKGAREQYVVEEPQYDQLPPLLLALADSLPKPKKKKK